MEVETKYTETLVEMDGVKWSVVVGITEGVFGKEIISMDKITDEQWEEKKQTLEILK